MFKEARSHDHIEAKNDMETHIRARKLPLTRKIYAFYRAPIVKFWSNTVWREHMDAHSHIQPSIMVVYQGRVLGDIIYKEQVLLLGTGCFCFQKSYLNTPVEIKVLLRFLLRRYLHTGTLLKNQGPFWGRQLVPVGWSLVTKKCLWRWYFSWKWWVQV